MSKLTVLAVRNAEPHEKMYRLPDGRGLNLQVEPNGSKYWRLRYRDPAGKPKMLGLGVYPSMTLAQAREVAEEKRRHLANGIDPVAQRRAEKLTRAVAAENTLGAVAREWIAVKRVGWADTYTEKVELRLENDVFPWLGDRPLKDVTAPEIFAVLQRVVARGTLDTAHRIRRHLSQIFRYAIPTERADRDPAADLKDTLPELISGRFPTITEPARIGELLRAIATYTGTYIVRAALQISPRVFCRPGDLRFAEWSEMDLERGEWTVPGAKLKGRKKQKAVAPPLIIPLSRQVVAILRELRPITGRGQHVFPNAVHRGRPMSENTLNAAIARLGFKGEIVTHGYRHMASTLLNEAGWEGDWVERQLAHKDKDAVRDIYNQAQYLKGRKGMLQAWSDYLDQLQAGKLDAEIRLAEETSEGKKAAA